MYFGTPKGIVTLPNSTERRGFNNMVYSESEIRRIAKVWAWAELGWCGLSVMFFFVLV